MVRRPGLVVALLLPLAGCSPEATRTRLVTPTTAAAPPTSPNPTLQQASYAHGSLDVAARVDTLGRQIVECNRQIGLRPLFMTLGDSRLGIWHAGTSQVWITEGLAKQCTTDGELAAVLCAELGQMVMEREILARPQARQPDRQPPINVPVGNDNAGLFGPADQTYLADRWKVAKDRGQLTSRPLPPPDPNKLACTYLTKAGFQAADLEAAAPLLRAASAYVPPSKQLADQTASRP